MARSTHADPGPVDHGTSTADHEPLTGPPDSAAWTVDDVQIEESPPPGRLRRPMDVLRLGASALLALLVGALAAGTVDASEELTVDLRRNVLTAPEWLIGAVAFAAALAGLLMIIFLLGSLALARRVRALVETLIGGIVGALLCWALNWWIDEAAPQRVHIAFEGGLLQQTGVPVPGYLAFLVGLLSVQGWRGRPWLIRASLIAVIGGALTALADGRTTLHGAIVAVLIGHVSGLAVRLGFGTPVRRPTGRDIATTLAASGLVPTRLTQSASEAHRFVAVAASGPLAVVMLFRDQLGGGLLSRAWRVLRARDEITAHHSITLRGMADQRALIGHAFEAAGVRAPRLRACLNVDSDTVLLAYDLVTERAVTAADATDGFQRDLWEQVTMMHRAGLAHRRLGPTGIRVDDAGRAWIVDRDGGQVAASDLAQLTDVTQLLVTLALLSTPQRAVENAVAVLGARRVGFAYPLLQPIVLSSSGRRALRGQGDLLKQLRSLLTEHGAEAGEAPELERFKPKRLLSVFALVIAVYLAGSQLADVDVLSVIGSADPAWIAAAFVACVLTYLFDPPALLAFVPQRISYLRAVGAQIALSFVKLIMPSTLGNAALDFRLLTRSGVPPATALAAAAASQALALIVAVPLLLILGISTGRAASVGITPSATSIVIVIAVIASLGLLALVSPVRRRARLYWESFAANGLSSLLDALQNPLRVLAAVGGALGVTFAFVACLYASLAAVGDTSVSFTVLAVVWLTGNTIGTAVPTPGGLGAVEVALTAGLTTAGVDGPTAISAVLLFRLITFWIPIPIGWLFWTQMQRKGLL